MSSTIRPNFTLPAAAVGTVALQVPLTNFGRTGHETAPLEEVLDRLMSANDP